MPHPKISIITPVYNTENYLEKTVQSILGQTFVDFELILIDDGSYDKSGEICNRLSHEDNRIRVFHTRNSGVSNARNLGLKEALGDWVLFVDSDDLLPVDALDKMYAPTICNNVVFVMGGYTICDNNGEIIYFVEQRINRVLSKEEALLQMFSPTPYNYMGFVCSKLYKTELIRQLELKFNTNIYFNEDRLFCVEYLSQTFGNTFFLTDSCYFYMENPQSAMQSLKCSYNKKYYTDFLASLLMLDILKENCSSIIKFAKSNVCKSYIVNHRIMASVGVVDYKLHLKMLAKLIQTRSIFQYPSSLYNLSLLLCPLLLRAIYKIRNLCVK